MATLTPEYRHEPVMLQEVLEALRLSEGSTVCDCTLGGAGHSVKMAAQVGEEGLLIGIDQDDMALAAARTRLASEAPGFCAGPRCPASMASSSTWAFRARSLISLEGASRTTRMPRLICVWTRVTTL